MMSSDKAKKKNSVKKRISFPEDEASNSESNLPNTGRKFHEATKTIIRQRSRYGKQINALWELFSEYSECSSLHGVKYVGEKKRHWIERAWWAFAFFLSLIICGNLIFNTYDKWKRFPVIVTFAEQSTRIWDIPFPAVTLCPQIKTKQTVFNFTKYYNAYQKDWTKATNLDPIELSRLKSAAQICKAVPQGLLNIGSENTTANEIYTDLKEMSPRISDIMYHCDFLGHKSTDCSKWFKEIWTEEGLCYSFNMLNASDLFRMNSLSKDYPVAKHNMSGKNWNIHRSYTTAPEDEIYPYRVFRASDGLTVSLKIAEKDLDYLCGGSVDGFKLLLHSPNEMPQMSKYYYRVPMKQEVIFSVKPLFLNTSVSLRTYSAERRQCYFESERHLKFFKPYTQRNCELECIARNIIRKCRCSPFFIPRNSSTPICGLANYKCHQKYKINRNQFGSCGCLPSCSSLSYDVEVSQAKFRLQRYFAAKKVNMSGHDVTRIFISFKDNQFFESRRSELYGMTDLLANCGGLLGLFMGFSFLSLVEVIYFCSLRLTCNLRRRHARKKKRLALMTQSYRQEDRF